MGGLMPRRVDVTLSESDREVLERWARRPKSAQALAPRCRIVLAAADGESSKEIAARLGCTGSTVGKWRGRFAEKGIDGLHDEPRPGQPRKITDAEVERVIVKTLEESPPNATHWSTRQMAEATGLNQTAISRIWRAFGLKPHRSEHFKLSPDPQFVDKVRDIVGLYLNPPEAAVVLCVDEKSQIQALERSAPILPLMPGVPERQTHDYVRNGTTNLYAALDTASGKVIAEMTPRHRAEEFRKFLFTPTYSSWLNLVERWFAELTTKWIKRGSHRSVRDLVASIRTWIANWNDDPKPYVWHKSADEILDGLASYCQRINDSGH